MDAGQMMMQMPVNAVLPVAVPASSTTGPSPALDQQSSDFAGVLAGMAPQDFPRPLGRIGTEKSVGGEAVAANGILLSPIQRDPGLDVVAAFRATLVKAVQAEPSDPGAGEDQTGPAEEKVSDDVVTPQDVVLCASGALVAAEQQINGRMPEQGLLVASRNGEHEKATFTTAVAALNPESSSGKILQQHVDKQVASDPTGAVSIAAQTASFPTEAAAALLRSSSAAEQEPVVPVEPPERGDVKSGVVTATTRPVPDSGVGTAAEFAGPASDLPQATVTPVQISAGTQMEAAYPVEAGDKGGRVEIRPADITVSPVLGTVSGEKPVTVKVETAGQFVLPETEAVDTGNAVQRQVVAMAEPAELVPRSTQNDSGLSDSRAADSALLAAASDKGQIALRPAEIRFSRSAAVEAVLENSLQAHDSASGNTEFVPEGEMRVTAAQQPAADLEAGFSGSNPGSDNRGFEGFNHTMQEPVRSSIQNTPGVQQHFSVDAKNTTLVQALQSEQSRPGSSEHIAGQVRDQLGTHEIKTGSEQITIRLSPEHLGDIRVTFRLEDRNLKVEIVTDNRFAKESLLQHADSLKESLARQNISMDKFEVSTGGGNSGNQGNNAQGEWRELARNRQSQQWLASGGYRTPPAGENHSKPVYFAGTEHAGLDLHF
jgi:hypothetical protein